MPLQWSGVYTKQTNEENSYDQFTMHLIILSTTERLETQQNESFSKINFFRAEITNYYYKDN